MGLDKGTLSFLPSGEDQRTRCARLLAAHCEDVFVSCRADQVGSLAPGLRALVDLPAAGDVGPAAGLLTAHRLRPDAAWFVLAVDFPWLDAAGVAEIVAGRAPGTRATCFVHEDGTSEPLLTIWEPAGLAVLSEAAAAGPRRVLEQGPVASCVPSTPRWLVNINTAAQLHGLGPHP